MEKLRCKNLSEIEGFEGFGNYLIMSDGKLFNTKTGKQLMNKKQYYQATLSGRDKDGNRISKTVDIHRIVALAFIPNPNNLPEVDHINGDAYCNNVSNLRWIDRDGNAANKKKYKKRKTRKTPVIVVNTKTRDVIGTFESLSEACRELNVNYSVAYAVITGIKNATQHGIKFIAI